MGKICYYSHGSFGGTFDILTSYVGKPCVCELLIQETLWKSIALCWMKNEFPHHYLWTFPKNLFCGGIDTITCFPCNISLVYCWHYVTRVIIASHVYIENYKFLSYGQCTYVCAHRMFLVVGARLMSMFYR